jgi:hypothetical protein
VGDWGDAWLGAGGGGGVDARPTPPPASTWGICAGLMCGCGCVEEGK